MGRTFALVTLSIAVWLVVALTSRPPLPDGRDGHLGQQTTSFFKAREAGSKPVSGARPPDGQRRPGDVHSEAGSGLIVEEQQPKKLGHVGRPAEVRIQTAHVREIAPEPQADATRQPAPVAPSLDPLSTKIVIATGAATDKVFRQGSRAPASVIVRRTTIDGVAIDPPAMMTAARRVPMQPAPSAGGMKGLASLAPVTSPPVSSKPASIASGGNDGATGSAASRRPAVKTATGAMRRPIEIAEAKPPANKNYPKPWGLGHRGPQASDQPKAIRLAQLATAPVYLGVAPSRRTVQASQFIPTSGGGSGGWRRGRENMWDRARRDGL